MPRYYFNLRNGTGTLLDPVGLDLADEVQAKSHAHQVALELMRSRNLKTRTWRLEICDAGHSPIFDFPFASVDPSLDHLPPPFRQTVERVSSRTSELSDAILEVRRTVHRLRGTLARSKGAPYLAATDGVPL